MNRVIFLSLTMFLSIPTFTYAACGTGLNDVKNVTLQLECKGAAANSAEVACVLGYENTQGEQVVYVAGSNNGNFLHKSSEVKADQYSLEAKNKRKMTPSGKFLNSYTKISTAKVEKLDSEAPTLQLKGVTKTFFKEYVDYNKTYNCSVIVR